jgi:hypothetical protein
LRTRTAALGEAVPPGEGSSAKRGGGCNRGPKSTTVQILIIWTPASLSARATPPTCQLRSFLSGTFKQHAPTGVRTHLSNMGYLSVLLAMPVGFSPHRVRVRGEPIEHAGLGIGLRRRRCRARRKNQCCYYNERFKRHDAFARRFEAWLRHQGRVTTQNVAQSRGCRARCLDNHNARSIGPSWRALLVHKLKRPSDQLFGVTNITLRDCVRFVVSQASYRDRLCAYPESGLRPN